MSLGGPQWWPLSKEELNAFLAVNLLMEIKRLPNHYSYWSRANQFLYYPSISSIMTCCCYEDITRCLQVVDNKVLVLAGDNAEFNRLCIMRWLLTKIKCHFKCNWNLN